MELPDEEVPTLPMFDIPDDAPCPGVEFDLPDEAPPPPAAAAEVLPAERRPTIRELRISPDVETYLAMLEAAIAPYEATAKAFAADMGGCPSTHPPQLQALGQQSLVAKEREKLLE